MHLQTAVEPYDLLRPLHRLRPADPPRALRPRRAAARPLHDGRRDFVTDDEAQLLRDTTMTINSFFGWEFNSCEALRTGRRLAPDRLRQRLPRLAGDVAALPLPVARRRQPPLVDLLRRHQAPMPRQPRLGAVLRDRRHRSCRTARSWRAYAAIAAERFETDEFEEFCATHLAHLDEVAWEFFGDAGGAATRCALKVAALFPAHEVEHFTELFWQRIQAWRATIRRAS